MQPRLYFFLSSKWFLLSSGGKWKTELPNTTQLTLDNFIRQKYPIPDAFMVSPVLSRRAIFLQKQL